mmetsp:Transcript_35993/g.83571  ORF Transcript_35993/g.83571 Transcript_35993/m.83571 type:complete len:239 (-) Transcript_35993:206-922(-)
METPLHALRTATTRYTQREDIVRPTTLSIRLNIGRYHSGETLKLSVVAGAHNEVDVSGGEELIGHNGLMRVAPWYGVDVSHEKVGGDVCKHADLCLQERCVHSLPNTGLVPGKECCHDCPVCVEASAEIRDGHSNLGGTVRPSDAHEPSDSLRHEVVARVMRTRPVTSIAGDRGVHKTRVPCRQSIVAKPQLFCVPDLVVFNNDIRIFCQSLNETLPFLRFEVNSKAAFVPVRAKKVS